MAKQKQVSERSKTFAKGGSGHMFGPQKAGPQKAGGTAHATTGDGGKFDQGGSGKMFGFHPAVPATAGITSAR